MEQSSSEEGSVSDSCDYGNKPSRFIKCGLFLVKLGCYQHEHIVPVPWN